jgi:hypothetical protein
MAYGKSTPVPLEGHSVLGGSAPAERRSCGKFRRRGNPTETPPKWGRKSGEQSDFGSRWRHLPVAQVTGHGLGRPHSGGTPALRNPARR